MSQGSAPDAPGLARPFDSLARWAEARAKELEVVAQRRDADGPAVDRALEIVRQFILDRGLILFGGLAIDYALRLKGARLYPDGERPDFDFLSPRAVDDAYDLADILQRAGFEGVGAIRAIHVQTMRVRTSFVYVADIGYVPREVFDALPTIEYQGMRVMHPDFQRLDQLLAFCFPFSNPPREDIFHRWRKDLRRFNLLNSHYPTAPGQAVGMTSTKMLSGQSAIPLVGDATCLLVALHGFAAYCVLRRSLDDLADALSAPLTTGAPRLTLTFSSETSFVVEAPTGHGPPVVVSPVPEKVVAGQADVQWYDPYMDLVPESVASRSLTVLSTRGRLLSTAVASAAPFVDYMPAQRPQLLVASPQYLMLYFLSEAHRAERDADRSVYLSYYHHTFSMVQSAEALFADAIAKAGDAAESSALMGLFVASPFAPNLHTLGSVNHDPAYLIRMASLAARLGDVPPPALGLEPGLAAILAGLPQNYYPGPGKQRPAFDYNGNALFRRSGQPRAP
jgi:hypothetical protein